MAIYGPVITAYVLVVAALLGLVMGSFVNCWAWRATHGESVLAGRSHCATCGHVLAARDLVPVVSWLAAGRKCRYCGQHVSARYPATEIVSAIAFVAIVAVYGLTLETVELLAFAGILLYLSLTDLDERIIPNGAIIAALAVRVAYMACAFALGWMDGGRIIYYVGSAFGVGLVLVVIVLVADKAFGRESMGGGDLKLYFAAGFYFGWQQMLFLVIASCVIGIIAAFATGAPAPAEGKGESEPEDKSGPDPAGEAENKSGPDPAGEAESKPEPESPLRRAIPFGPSIAAACIITMLVGTQVSTWYFSLL